MAKKTKQQSKSIKENRCKEKASILEVTSTSGEKVMTQSDSRTINPKIGVDLDNENQRAIEIDSSYEKSDLIEIVLEGENRVTSATESNPVIADIVTEENRLDMKVRDPSLVDSVVTKVIDITAKGDEVGNQLAQPWAALFGSNRNKTAEGELRFVPPAVKNGTRIVRFSSTKAAKWRNAVVASVYGEIPKFYRFQSFATNRWKSLGLISVQLIKDNVFLLNFDSFENRMRVLGQGPYTFNRKPLLMQEWTERMDLTSSSIHNLHIWIQLPLLPLELWTHDILSGIGSVCGKPLFVDQCTLNQTRLGYARLLVEMDIFGDFPNETVLEDELGVQFTQKILYEWKPDKCKTCQNIGHKTSQCKAQITPVWKAKPQQVSNQVGAGKVESTGPTKMQLRPDNISQQPVTMGSSDKQKSTGAAKHSDTSIDTVPPPQVDKMKQSEILQKIEWPELGSVLGQGGAAQSSSRDNQSQIKSSQWFPTKDYMIGPTTMKEADKAIGDQMVEPSKKKPSETKKIGLGPIRGGRKSTRVSNRPPKYS